MQQLPQLHDKHRWPQKARHTSGQLCPPEAALCQFEIFKVVLAGWWLTLYTVHCTLCSVQCTLYSDPDHTDHASESGAMPLQSVEVGYQHVDWNPEEKKELALWFEEIVAKSLLQLLLNPQSAN